MEEGLQWPKKPTILILPILTRVQRMMSQAHPSIGQISSYIWAEEWGRMQDIWNSIQGYRRLRVTQNWRTWSTRSRGPLWAAATHTRSLSRPTTNWVSWTLSWNQTTSGMSSAETSSSPKLVGILAPLTNHQHSHSMPTNLGHRAKDNLSKEVKS